MDLSERFANFIERHRLGGTAGVVAVSGGPDSVALAQLFIRLLQDGRVGRLIVAHVNHQLRGAESDADEAFVQSLAQRWDEPRLTVRTVRIAVAALADAERDNLESVARRERYRWLTQVAQAVQADWIATGHSADDQAETVLFRLLRGSGLLGLGAMAEARRLDEGPLLIRPLLSVRRHEILDYLHDKQIPYRVDSSNRDLGFTRNRLRLELMPLLEARCNPAVVDVLCRLAEQARELHAEITQAAEQLLHKVELPRAGNILVFAIDRLRDRPANLVREMFRRVWQREAWPMGDMDFARWDRLVEIVQGTCPACDFPGPIHVRRVGRVLQLQPAPAQSS